MAVEKRVEGLIDWTTEEKFASINTQMHMQ
jgi:hypothetical protein